MIQRPNNDTLDISINKGLSENMRGTLTRPSSAGLIIDKRTTFSYGNTARIQRLKAGAPEKFKPSIPHNRFKSLRRAGTEIGTKIVRTGSTLLGHNENSDSSSVSGTIIQRGGKGARIASRSTQATISTARKSIKVIRSVAHAAKTGYFTAKASITAAAAPYIGVVLIALLIALVIGVVTIGSMFFITSVTAKSNELELTKTYSFITELDLHTTQQILNLEDTQSDKPDEYHYFLNGVAVPRENIRIQTNADLFLIYLDLKYDDYTLDGILRMFGVKVRNEITQIHQQLYTIDTVLREIEITPPLNPPVIPPDPGDPPRDPPTPPPYQPLSVSRSAGGQSTGTAGQKKKILEIRVTAVPLEDYILSSKGHLNEDQAQRFEMMKQFSYTTLRDFRSPFPDHSWGENISSRFGWRNHPITGEAHHHNGIDIAMPLNTPIHAVMSGIVLSAKFDSHYGNVAVIESISGDRKVTYAHCSSLNVIAGQEVSRGEIIGYVGNTGVSSGSHLHIEYCKKGNNLNPAFYLQGGP